MDPISSEPFEEKEGDMSSLTAGFAARMRKWATSAEGETTPGSEASGGKCTKQSGPDEEARKDPVVMLWTL